MAEKDWLSKLKTTLRLLYDIEYEKLAFQKLWGIQLLILVKPEHHKKITHLQFSQVRTGIGNALGKQLQHSVLKPTPKLLTGSENAVFSCIGHYIRMSVRHVGP